MDQPFALCCDRKTTARIAVFTLYIEKKKKEFDENTYHP